MKEDEFMDLTIGPNDGHNWSKEKKEALSKRAKERSNKKHITVYFIDGSTHKFYSDIKYPFEKILENYTDELRDNIVYIKVKPSISRFRYYINRLLYILNTI